MRCFKGNRLVLPQFAEHHKLLQRGLGACRLMLEVISEMVMPMTVYLDATEQMKKD
jgi:hypothetical protein